jgi:hypothetical protein
VRHFAAEFQSGKSTLEKVMHMLDARRKRTADERKGRGQNLEKRGEEGTKAIAPLGRLPLFDELPCRRDEAVRRSVKNKIKDDQDDHRYAQEPAKDIRHDELLRS